MELSDFWGLAGLPFVMALVQVVKAYVDDKRAYPLVAMAFGIAINLAVGFQTGVSPLLAVLLGVVVGLAASGLYSSGKAISGN